MGDNAEKVLSAEELGALSFMHYYLAIENLPEREHADRIARWDCDYDQRRATADMKGGVLMQSPLLSLRELRVEISGWMHFEVFRRFGIVGWATDTRRPINTPYLFHQFSYHPGVLHIRGLGTDPCTHYIWLFEKAAVTAVATLDPEQQLLRQEHAANFERRRRALLNNPEDARLRIPLDEEDEKFLRNIADGTKKDER